MELEDRKGPAGTEAQDVPLDPSSTVKYQHYQDAEAVKAEGEHKLKMPTLGQLLRTEFKQRRYLLQPWLREQENCMVYAATGVGKSLFAMSAALAVAGNTEFLGWRPEKKPDGAAWRVLYVDGEMHIGDIQERARLLRDGMQDLDRTAVDMNLSFLARQHQDAGVQFPSITDQAGQEFVLEQIRANKVDLVILDNFSTLGEVEDENSASSFNAIQQFLLKLKVQEVATMLVHHTGKAEDNFRGSSKLSATFETIIQLGRPQVQQRKIGGGMVTRVLPSEHGTASFRVRWDKVRAGSKRPMRDVVAKLVPGEPETFGQEAPSSWEYADVDLDRLDELAERLPAGEFQTQKEIADFFDVSPTMAKKYLDRGITLGIWTDLQIGRWLALGKRLRTQGKTDAPVRPDSAWKDEPLDAEQAAVAF